jgi:hypothetical protein
MTAYRLHMSIERAGVGPLQLVLVGFETTERFRGDIARELLDLRGRGMIRILHARLSTARPTATRLSSTSDRCSPSSPRSAPTRSPGCWASTVVAGTAGSRRRRRLRERPASRWKTCAA